jgi:hypothetical protein
MEKAHDPTAHQGLAAGDPNLTDAQPGGNPGQPQQLLIAENFPGRQFLPILPIGAVDMG